MTHTLRYSILFFLTILVCFNSLEAQSYFEDGLSAEFHRQRRETLRNQMPENSVAILFNAPERVRSNDTHFPYRPDSDFYYLTGLREPNSALIIFKNSQNFDGFSADELLFVAPKNPAKEQWDGILLGTEGAKKQLEFAQVFTNDQFLKTPAVSLQSFTQILLPDNPLGEAAKSKEPLTQMWASLQLQLQPEGINTATVHRYLGKMRTIKTPEEIALIRRAVQISGQAHIEAMKSIKPGVSEYQIQAVHEYMHRVLGAEAQAYGSIVGAGNNACILHYVDNSKKNLQNGLVLMDVGAEYRGYAGDITRTVPVRGVFSPEEKQIYTIVLQALEEGNAMAKNGNEFMSIQRAASRVINTGLAELGIIKPGERHGYFPHGVSHHLGLDVHDRGSFGRLEPGMVLTVEPGIYIPEGSPCDPKWWGIGIRIEDNILITTDGNENLSDFVPKTIKDIEALMKQKGILQSTPLK